MHSGCRAEPGLSLVVNGKAGLLIEAAHAGWRSPNPADSTPARNRDQVQHQRPPGSVPHPRGIDKQILNLDTIPGGEPGGEADDGAIGYCHTRASRQ